MGVIGIIFNSYRIKIVLGPLGLDYLIRSILLAAWWPTRGQRIYIYIERERERESEREVHWGTHDNVFVHNLSQAPMSPQSNTK
jgi:hypothetical protein